MAVEPSCSRTPESSQWAYAARPNQALRLAGFITGTVGWAEIRNPLEGEDSQDLEPQFDCLNDDLHLGRVEQSEAAQEHRGKKARLHRGWR